MSGGFQTSVGTQPSPAVAGDFADTNPRVTVDAGQGALVAGASGVTVGYFAWANYAQVDNDNGPAIVNNFGYGSVTGFVAREQQGLNTTFLSDASMVIPKGLPITLFSAGSFWVKNNGTTQATIGQTAYADLQTGQVSFASASASITGSIAAKSLSLTASITGNVMTVTGGTGATPIVVGAILSGTAGGGVQTNTQIVAQLSGTPGGLGTYAVNIPEQNIPSSTITCTYGLLTVTAVASGAVEIGALVGGTGVAASTYITSIGAVVGGNQTYNVNLTQTVGTTTMTPSSNIATKFVAVSSGIAGDLVKISSHLLG